MSVAGCVDSLVGSCLGKVSYQLQFVSAWECKQMVESSWEIWWSSLHDSMQVLDKGVLSLVLEKNKCACMGSRFSIIAMSSGLVQSCSC